MIDVLKLQLSRLELHYMSINQSKIKNKNISKLFNNDIQE